MYNYMIMYDTDNLFFYRNLVTFIGSLVFMIHLTWKLSTITLVGIPVLTMISHIFGNNQKVL